MSRAWKAGRWRKCSTPHYHVNTEPIGPGPGVLVEIERTGFHCVLVRREVFERVPGPWFDHPTPGRGEDDYFCDRVRSHGEHVYLDPCIEVGHLTLTSIDNAYQTAYWQTPADQAAIRRHQEERAAAAEA